MYVETLKRFAPSISWQGHLSLVCLSLATVILIGFQAQLVGWLLVLTGASLAALSSKELRRHLLLLYLSVSIIGLVPIQTATSNENFMRMGSALLAAIALPYVISRYVYKDRAVRFQLHHGRRWYKSEVFYIFLTALVAYFLLPFYLRTSGAYLNWEVGRDLESIIRLFIGTNALGIWDELFFVCTALGLLRLHLPFKTANALQAVLFTSFLYELGFTGWGPVIIYPFALLQGYIFKRTDSLLYVITIHLTLDFVLFLALINAHHSDLANIFIT